MGLLQEPIRGKDKETKLKDTFKAHGILLLEATVRKSGTVIEMNSLPDLVKFMEKAGVKVAVYSGFSPERSTVTVSCVFNGAVAEFTFNARCADRSSSNQSFKLHQ